MSLVLITVTAAVGAVPAGLENALAVVDADATLPVIAEARPTEVELIPAPDAPAVEINGADDPSRWHLHARVATGAMFDDNIFIQESHRDSDVIMTASPRIDLGYGNVPRPMEMVVAGIPSRFSGRAQEAGNSVIASYTPTVMVFTEHEAQSRSDHDAALRTHWHESRSTFDMEARLLSLSTPDYDVGTRVDRIMSSVTADGGYAMTKKTSLTSRASVAHASYDTGFEVTNYEIRGAMDYEVSSKTAFGIGEAVGYTVPEGGTEQIFEQSLLHLRYRPTAKLTIEGEGGIEVRWANSNDRANPIFSAALVFAPMECTLLSIYGSRKTESSPLLLDENIERTSSGISFRQRFWQRVYVTWSGGYEHADYVSADHGTIADREDNHLNLGIAVAMEITKWVSARMAYQRETNDSSAESFSFTRNAASLEMVIQF